MSRYQPDNREAVQLGKRLEAPGRRLEALGKRPPRGVPGKSALIRRVRAADEPPRKRLPVGLIVLSLLLGASGGALGTLLLVERLGSQGNTNASGAEENMGGGGTDGGGSEHQAGPDSQITESPTNPYGTGAFDFPVDGDRVTSLFPTRGSATLPAGRALWILSQPDNDMLYTTSRAPLLVDTKGRWDVASVGIGRGDRDAGRTFDLLLVSASVGEIEAALNGRDWVEFAGLPRNTHQLARVTVELAAA